MKRFFLLLPALPFLVLFFDPHRFFILRDISLVYLPAKHFWAESVRQWGYIPHWNPLAYAGSPFWADLNQSPLYIFNFIFLLFPDAYRGFLIFMATHALFFTVGAYLYFRDLRLRQAEATLASLCLALGGLSFSLSNLMNVASSYAALPYFFYCIRRLMKRQSGLWFVAAGICLVWPVYAGDPQFSYWMGLGAALMFFSARRGSRALVILGGLAFFSLLLGAAQILPALALARESIRGLQSEDLMMAELFSLHPARLIEFFMPFPFGNVLAGEPSWLASLTARGFSMPFLLHLYLGVVPAVFFLQQLIHGLRRPVRFLRRPILWAGLVLLVWLALGKFAPLYGLFYKVVPAWSFFRYPERLAIPLTFLLFTLAAPGFRWFFSRPAKAARPFILPLLALLWLAAAALNRFTQSAELSTLSLSLVYLFPILFLFQTLASMRGRLPPRIQVLLLTGLVALDLLPHAFALLFTLPAKDIAIHENPVAEKIQKHLAERAAELHTGGASRYFHGTYGANWVAQPRFFLEREAITNWAILYPNLPEYFSLATPTGYGAFDPTDMLNFWNRLRELDPERLINLFSVAYLAGYGPEGQPTVRYNLQALPELWLPPAAAIRPENSEQFLWKADFPYRTKVVLEGAREDWASPPWVIRSRTRSPDHLQIQLEAKSPEAVFVWNERFHKNWKAYFDGKSVPVVRANGWAMAVRLGEASRGEHRLEFHYEDNAAKTGLWLSFGGLLLAVATISSSLWSRLGRAQGSRRSER